MPRFRELATQLALAGLLIFVANAPRLHAQVTTGTIVGTLSDANGVIPGASVVVREVNKNTSATVVTDAAGGYTAPFLVPGTYAVEVHVQGYKKWMRDDIILQVNQRARVDVQLEVGGLEETTTVVGSAPLLNTDSSEIGTVIEERAIKELPLNGRNFATLVYLTPGVTPGQAGENLSGASTFNPRGASNFNALGHQANANAWLIDGIDNNEFTFNTVIVSPSVEQVREFKVLTGVFSAEFGRGAGVVSVSTKSGTNMLRGTAFEYLRNDAFDARNFFVRKVMQADGTLLKDPVPPLDRHQFGGALGGALVIPGLYDGHDRTFFFADYAGLKERRGVTTVNTVPTARTRLGDFSDYRDRNGNLIPIFDPLTTRLDAQGRVIRDQFPNNVIPVDRISRVGGNIASLYPLPNNGTGNFDNYISTPDREITDNAFSGRVDHRMSGSDSFFVRFNYGKFKLDAPQGQANCCLPTPPEAAARFDLGPFVAGIQNTRLTTHGAAFNYSKVIRSNLVNELRVGYAKTEPYTTQSDYGHYSADSIGIAGINVTEIATGLPNINVTNFTGLSGGPNFLPVNPKQFHYQIEDALVWLKGRHQFKFGYRLVDRSPSPFTHTDTRSTITFGTSFVNNPLTNTGGTGLAAVLLGNFNSASRGFLVEPYTLSVVEHGAFVQDDFKVNNRLTVNAGVRYELFMAPTEERDRLANFDYQNFRLVYAGVDGTSRSANKKTHYLDLAPRLGLTYDLTGDARTILRTGFGVTFFPDPHAAGNLHGLNVPFAVSQNVQHETNPLNMSALRTIDNPFPPIVPVQPKTTAELIAANPRVQGHSFENETPYAQQWHLGVERQVFRSMLVELAYVGSAGKHLMLCYNPNEVQPGTTSQASRRLLQPIAEVSNMLQCDPRNRSTYHAGTLKVQQRFSDGLQFLVSYTYGKALDYGGSAASGGGAVGNGQTITNIDAWHGPSGFDTRHRAVISHVYELPWGPGRRWLKENDVLGAVVGGWQLAGITTLTTGRPFSLSLNAGVNNGAPSWPNRIGPGTLENPTVDLWFNPADFVAPPANTYGNAGRGILYAPGHVNFDTSLSKRFSVFGRTNAEFRWDAFNLFNHPGFGFPNSAIGNATAGTISTTIVDNRSMQFALKFNF
jgi:Carboxypeptidase regulatory-like domain/TonB-dependent Receptor Plug Domain/TonB dependent receptor-like, beta-barrel